MQFNEEYENKIIEELESKEINIMFDSRCSVLSKEDQNFYIIPPVLKKKNKEFERVYLSKELYFRYLDELVNKNIVLRSSVISAKQKSKDDNFLLDIYPEYKKLILKTLQQLIDVNYYHGKIKRLILGLNKTLVITKHLNIYFDNFKNINQDDINCIDRKVVFELDKYTRKDLLCINTLRIGLKTKNITPFKSLPVKSPNKNEALSETDVFKLDIIIRKIFKEIQVGVKKLENWKSEYENIEYLFSLKNIAYTVYNSEIKSYITFLQMAKDLYGVDLKCWKSKRGNKFTYIDKQQKELHAKYIKLSRNGIYIDYKSDEKIFYWWILEIFENFPNEITIKEKYKNIFRFTAKDFRSQYSKFFKKEIHNLDRFMFPSSEECTLIYLFIMCRENINSDVLRNWKVKKINNYFHLGIPFPDGVIISGKKGRSNYEEKEFILTNDSEHKKLLDFFTKWSQQLYTLSNKDDLFQYADIKMKPYENQGRIRVLTVSTIGKRLNICKNYYLTKKFIEKYDIDINKIQLTKFRPYHNTTNYIKGLNFIERQIDLGHNNIETQKRYESSIQGSQITNKRISNCLNDVISRIENNDNNTYYKGLLANCKNPKEPTYLNAKKLKKDERCSDWFKCLSCRQCRIIPNENVPYIKARLDYMEYQRTLISDIAWKDHFSDDYTLAMEVWNYFTDKDKKIFSKKAEQFSETVKHKFSPII